MTTAPDPDRVALLVAEVRKAPKSRHVFPPFIADRCVEEIQRRGGTNRDIIKRVKRSLHQVGGAYLTPPPRYDRLLASLANASPGPEREAVARDLVGGHASMRERTSALDEYYSALFDGLTIGGTSIDGTDATVLDLACGLNPLARSVMSIDITAYLACDLYLDMLDFVAEASSLLGYPVETFPWDLVAGPPPRHAAVVLLLKTLPCLDQLDPTAGRRLVAGLALTSTHLLVSYPVRSLGGAEKGMRDSYSASFRSLVDDVARDLETEADLTVTPLDLPAELGYRITFAR